MNRLKELRLAAGKTQQEIGDLVGITAAAMSYYETGKRGLDASTIVVLCDYYGVSADYLLGREEKRKKCVFAGTFDPFTLGHQKTVDEALALFDLVIIAVMVNKNKTPTFSINERTEIINALYGDERRVKVVVWEGIVADLLKKENTTFYIRGLRNSSDYEYETADYYASKQFNEAMTEIYFPCPQEYLHISSTLVKNSLAFDKPIDKFVSPLVKDYIVERYKEKERNTKCLKSKTLFRSRRQY